MTSHVITFEVSGPWSLATSRRFWEGFTPSALPGQAGQADPDGQGRRAGQARQPAQAPDPGGQQHGGGPGQGRLSTVFRVDADWSRAAAEVSQQAQRATVKVTGDGDLDAAAAQACRFLALDIDASGWPAVGDRDPVIADAQRRLPGLRPCGFHSPYEAAAWAVLSQRLRIIQAARLREDLVARHGDAGAFPAPERLLALDLDLPGRKPEYLRAVAEAALGGELDGAAIRQAEPEESVRRLTGIKGIGPFAAELIVLRGANAPDALPRHEGRLTAEVAERYGQGKAIEDVSRAWRPFRTWAAVHLRALREARTGEIEGTGPSRSRA
jgi:DNA-3-methyladenine glycosylase II